jgi:hypothetical protein
MKPREVGNNIARLIAATDGWVNLETHHGAIREGRLSGWTCRTLKLNGVDVQLPVGLELNGDPHDIINLYDIKKLDVDPKR